MELAFLRNDLASGKYDTNTSNLLYKIKMQISNSNSPFKELAMNALVNCENDLKNKDFTLASFEINLIHNFTFENLVLWDSNHFYSIELLSYIENVENVARIRKLILLLGRLEEKLLNSQE